MIDFPDKKPISRYVHDIRSRYAETDQMGYVYYGRYPEFFEVARTEMMRSLGISYSSLEDDGIMLPVISMEIEYKSPVFYDEKMRVEVMLFDEPLVKLHTYYLITTGRQRAPHVKGRVSLCFVNSQTRRPVKAPVNLLEKLRK
ncbi:thioesterase family protein [soil metagenome]